MKNTLLLFFFLRLATTLSFGQVPDLDIIPFLKANGRWTFANAETMEVVIKKDFQDVNLFKKGLATVKENNKYGVIDKKGKILISFKYNYLHLNENGNFISSENAKGEKAPMYKAYEIGFDGKENLIADFYYTDKDNLYPFYSNKKAGFMDRNNNIIIPAQYDGVDKFKEGYAEVRIKSAKGLIDKTGQFVIQPEFEQLLYDPISKMAYARTFNRKVYYIDLEGNKLEINYSETGYFFKGDYNYVRNEYKKYGIIDKKGKIIVPLIYDYITIIDRGFVVYDGGRSALIDKNNQFILPFDYDFIWFHENSEIIVISKNKKVGVMNLNFEMIIPYTYESISKAIENKKTNHNDIAIAKKNGKYGVIDFLGNVYIPFEWDEIKVLNQNENTLIVKKNDRYGLLNKENKILTPVKYLDILAHHGGWSQVITEYFENIYVDPNGREFVED
jgi:hypothetical protein